MSRDGTPVCWSEEYIRTGKRERIEVEKVDSEAGVAVTIGRALSVESAREYIAGADPGRYRIVRVTHEVVDTITRENDR